MSEVRGFDVAVIGGGVIGTSIAYHAAKRGLSRRFEVLNFAVAAYSPLQRFEAYRRKARKFRPDLVLYSATMLDNRLAETEYIGLGELAELPASPCLSSRIETGIAIDPVMLECVHETERLVDRELKPKTVRCRVRAGGVVIELDEACLAALPGERRAALTQRVQALFGQRSFAYGVSFERYRVGSAFLHFKRPVT